MTADPKPGAAGLMVLRPHPTHRDLEAFALARLGCSKAKARRLARAAHGEPDPYEAVLGRTVARRMRGRSDPDPTGNTAVANAMRRRRG